MLNKLDFYIIRKFLGTYFFAILLIIGISVVFDFTEKLDNFMKTNAPIKAIVFDYYLNFIPYFANLFSPLFTFIAVIFFTSKLAYNTEIIAMLSSGISFRRILVPYFVSAAIIALLSFYLSSYIIPPANKARIDFEDQYVKSRKKSSQRHFHIEIEPGTFVYLYHFKMNRNKGNSFTLERIKDGKLLSKTTAASIEYSEETGKWSLFNYVTRDFSKEGEQIIKGNKIDTTLNMSPADFIQVQYFYQTMDNKDLSEYIDAQKLRGVANTEEYIVERHKRFANPFAAFILTLIGVSLSSRKVRGGTGLHIGIGIALSFSYILFSTVSTTFAINGSMEPFLAVWLPNLVYTVIGIFLYQRAPK